MRLLKIRRQLFVIIGRLGKCLRANTGRLLPAILSVSVGLSFILSTGPEIQLCLLALARDRATSIYSSMYNDSIIQFPSILQWLSVGLNPLYFLMSVFITTFSLQTEKFIAISYRCTLSTFFVLFGSDIVNAASSRTLPLAYAIENFFFDLFGALAISIVIVTILLICELWLTNLPGNIIARKYLTTVIPPVLGVLFSIFTFFIVELFYKPLPAAVDILLDQSTEGTVSSDNNNISLSPKGILTSIAHLTNIDGQMKTIWTKAGRTKFDATFSIYAYCLDNPPLKGADKPLLTFTARDVDNISLAFDNGTSFLSAGDHEAGSQIEISGTNPEFFRIDQDDKSHKMTIRQFFDGGQSFSEWPFDDSLTLFVSAPLGQGSSNTYFVSSRTLALKLNGLSYALNFSEKENGAKATFSDSNADADFLRTLTHNYLIPGPVVGLKVTIAAQPGLDMVFGTKDSVLHVVGADGWLGIDNIDNNEASSINLQNLNFISFSSGISSIEVYGEPLSISPDATYQARGSFTASPEEDGRLHFTGIADAFWSDNKRINQTLWENFDVEERIFFAGVFVSFLGGFAAIFTSKLKNYSSSSWLTA